MIKKMENDNYGLYDIRSGEIFYFVSIDSLIEIPPSLPQLAQQMKAQ